MKLGISSCLLGNLCRYDGTGAKDKYIVNVLSNYFSFVPYCPEASFLPTPRDTIRLVEVGEEIRAKVEAQNDKDITKDLVNNSHKLSDTIKDTDICGFILKSKSPSCGMERVRLYHDNDSKMFEKKAVGIFAQQIKDKYPFLPIEEESRLNDPWLRENFLMQVYAYQDIHDFLNTKPKFKDLVLFHSNYKYLFMSKNIEVYKKLGRVVANHNKKELNEVLIEYKQLFLEGISYKSSIGRTYNVLQHLFGYLKEISQEQKEDLLKSLNQFKNQKIPLITVIKMLNIYINIEKIEYLKTQKFLNPYPEELALRSDIKSGKK